MATMPRDIIVTDIIEAGAGAITAPNMTKEQAEQVAHDVATHRKNIDWHNPAVCIDGRCCARVDDSEPLPLGAHMAGGAETVLVAAASVGLDLGGKELVAKAKELGFTLGAHCDTTNRSENFKNGTGCGANDKVDIITDEFTKNKAGIGQLLSGLMGANFKADVYSGISLSAPAGSKTSLMEHVGEENVETLEDDGQGVHGHREEMVIFNYEEGTTIDRDAYFAATGKQVFVIDVWYIQKLANALSSGIHADRQASELFHSMMAYQVATYIGLCDGSHRAALMMANELPEAA